MKKILFILSIVALAGYGCNRDEKATGTGTGVQQEESRMDTQTAPDTSMGAGATDEAVTEPMTDSDASDVDNANMNTQQRMEEGGTQTDTELGTGTEAPVGEEEYIDESESVEEVER